MVSLLLLEFLLLAHPHQLLGLHVCHETLVLLGFVLLGAHGRLPRQLHLNLLALLVFEESQRVLLSHALLPLIEFAGVAHVDLEVGDAHPLDLLALLEQHFLPEDGCSIQFDVGS